MHLPEVSINGFFRGISIEPPPITAQSGGGRRILEASLQILLRESGTAGKRENRDSERCSHNTQGTAI
jgi:hypothetical protein